MGKRLSCRHAGVTTCMGNGSSQQCLADGADLSPPLEYLCPQHYLLSYSQKSSAVKMLQPP